MSQIIFLPVGNKTTHEYRNSGKIAGQPASPQTQEAVGTAKPLTKYTDGHFSNNINKRNQDVKVDPWGTFTVRSGHTPKMNGKMLYYAWPVRAPVSFKWGLCFYNIGKSREEAIASLVTKLKELSKKPPLKSSSNSSDSSSTCSLG